MSVPGPAVSRAVRRSSVGLRARAATERPAPIIHRDGLKGTS